MTMERISYFTKFFESSNRFVVFTRVMYKATWRYFEPRLAESQPVAAQSYVIWANILSLLKLAIAYSWYSPFGAESIEAYRHLRNAATDRLRSVSFCTPILIYSLFFIRAATSVIFVDARYSSVSVIWKPDPSSSS